MVGITKPNEDISYRLKNVDFGTYLELRERDGSLVLRPEKDSRLSQFVSKHRDITEVPID
jgi:hypothetical protein